MNDHILVCVTPIVPVILKENRKKSRHIFKILATCLNSCEMVLQKGFNVNGLIPSIIGK